MNPITVSAQLAAFVWFTHGKTCLDGRTRSEAMRFARDNWEAFLPLAHEGLGRLLLKIARRPAPKRRRGAPSRLRRLPHLAAAEVGQPFSAN